MYSGKNPAVLAFLATNFPIALVRATSESTSSTPSARASATSGMTLLSSLFIFTPCYVQGDASGKKAVEALRKERNDLAHDAHVLARLSLTEEQFQIKWEIVSA